MVGPVENGNQPGADHRTDLRWKLWLKSAARILGRILLVLAVLIFVAAAAFLFAPTRGALLGWGVGLADKALPGHLEAGEVTWPSLGRLVLGDVLWVSGSSSAPGDTLVDLASLDLRLDLGVLKNRDGRVEFLQLDVRRLDVPAIVAATSYLAAESLADTTSSVTEPAGFPFLQSGSLPGIPSVSLAALDLKVGRAVLAPGMTVKEVDLSGWADLERNRPARVVVDHLGTRLLTAVGDTAGAPEWEVVFEHLGLGLTLEFPDDPSGGWDLVAATLDSLNLDIAPTANPALQDIWRVSEPVNLNASGRVERKGEIFTGHLDGDFVLPGSAHFHPWLPEDFPHHEFESVSGTLAVEGNYADPLAKGALQLDLGSNTWVEYGVVAGGAEANLDTLRAIGPLGLTARLDTLDIALDGIRVTGFGNWGSKGFDLGLVTSLTDFRLPGLFASWVDPALQEAWQDPGPVSLNVDARVGRTGQEYSGLIEGDFNLTGFALFHPWLPEDFPHEEFETLSGELNISGNYSDPRAQGSVHLDLGSNPWMEMGLIEGFAEADIDSLMTSGLRHLTARLEALKFALEGIRVDASGELGPDIVALDLEGEVTDFQLAGLFAGPDLADAVLELHVDANVAGSLAEPQVDAWIGGGFLQDGIKIPTFDFTLDGDRRNVAAFLTAGGGLEYEGVTLDSVRAEVQGEMVALDSLAANFGLALWKEENRLALGGSVRGDSVRVVHLDSLVTVFFGQEMRTSGPTTLAMGPGPGVFDLTELEFIGPPGQVTARGFWNDEAMDLEAGIDLLLREATLMEIAPSPLWSRNGGIDLKLEAVAGLENADGEPQVEGRVGAAMLPHRDDPPLGIVLDFISRGGENADLSADFALTLADTAILEAQLDWPGKPGPENGFWRPDPEKELTLTVPSQELDLARFNSRLPSEVVLVGRFDVEAEVRVFPPREGEAPLDSLAVIPLRGSLDGSLRAPVLRVDLPNRSWLNTAFDVSFSGPLEDPRVGAKVEVKSGFIRIPEIPRNLHPVEGTSLLWALNDSLLAAMDSTAADSLGGGRAFGRRDNLVVFLPPDQTGPSLDQQGPVVLPDLEVEVVISEDLRIIGYSIDMKLGGRLGITRGFDEDNLPGPSIRGDLNVPEGSLKVMNRVFQVERGHIKFNGTVPPNPNLNLMLETQVNAYLLRVLVSGRAEAPVIELTSEPELTEEDIMAVLLFGQPMNDLDSDQRGRMDEENDPTRELQKNLAGLAMAFGTKGLQDSMNVSFGVDMVQMGSDSSGGSTLMVGKFITPDIILKYNQSLEKSGTYFMTLEYSLNRYFKVVSTYGQGEEASGAELKWTRRY